MDVCNILRMKGPKESPYTRLTIVCRCIDITDNHGEDVLLARLEMELPTSGHSFLARLDKASTMSSMKANACNN